MFGLTELRSMSMEQLYDILRSTHSDDRNLKIILNERHAAGWTAEFKPPTVARSFSTNHQQAISVENPGDTELTILVRRSYHDGYRGEGTNDPQLTVQRMLTQIDMNTEESEIDFEPIQNFWKMFRTKYSMWRAKTGKVRA
jgi:hypothetical protein